MFIFSVSKCLSASLYSQNFNSFQGVRNIRSKHELIKTLNTRDFINTIYQESPYKWAKKILGIFFLLYI